MSRRLPFFCYRLTRFVYKNCVPLSMSRTRLQSCNRGNRRGIATETVEPLHSKLVFYTFAIKSVSTVKLMHPYYVKIELWKRAKGCFRGEWGPSPRREPSGG